MDFLAKWCLRTCRCLLSRPRWTLAGKFRRAYRARHVPPVRDIVKNRPCNFSRAGRGRGYVLLEAVLAVAIFALGMLALGHCISQGLMAERVKTEDARARRVLQNRFAEIEAGAAAV